MDQDEAGARRNAKKGRGQYPSILTHLFSNEGVEAIVTNQHRSCRERLESSRRPWRGSIRFELGWPKASTKGLCKVNCALVILTGEAWSIKDLFYGQKKELFLAVTVAGNSARARWAYLSYPPGSPIRKHNSLHLARARIHPYIKSFHMNGSVIIHYADDKVHDISNTCELHRDHFQTAVLERLGRRGSKN